MRFAGRLLVVAAIAGSQAVVVAQQSETDSQFRIDYSASGITSLKHDRDKYDTDYVAPGRALGDVTIRYRTTGEKTWRKISAATANATTESEHLAPSYTIGRLTPTTASLSRASASVPSPDVFALNDQILPEISHEMGIQRFVWQNRKGTKEWVQYDLPEAHEISSVEVYWALEDDPDNPCKLPKSWRVVYRDGENWKEVSARASYPLKADQENKVDFAPVTISAIRIEAQLADNATAGIFEWRINDEGRTVEPVHDLEAKENFHLQGKSLVWNISLKNNTDREMEVGDFGIPLHFNTDYVWDKTETYTKRLIPHTFLGGNGAFIFWMRTNAEGPYLVMTPLAGTGLEYFDQTRFQRGYSVYVHSAATGEELRTKGGTWRLPNTRLILSPKGKAGDSATYGFRFRWAGDFAGVRDVLYEEGSFDINVVPGMTVPTDLTAMFSLRTCNEIRAVEPEYPDKTKIDYVGERGKDVRVYTVRFSRLGENLLKVRYGRGQYLPLEFFVTEPLETLFKKRAEFIVKHEQVKDPSK